MTVRPANTAPHSDIDLVEHTLDDASIHSGSPGSNYGANPTLYVDNSPKQDFLIKFQVNGLAGHSVTSATLRDATVARCKRVDTWV